MWRINGDLGRHTRPGRDASGWLWEIVRNGASRRVLVEITGTAHASRESSLPGDTAAAIRTEGHSEIVKILRMEEPPTVITCGTMGCHYISPDELAQ